MTNKLLTELITLLNLEHIEEDIFRGQSQDLGLRQLFGGQVLGQALSAASHTVPDDRSVHSLHGYFLRRGDSTKPVVFFVDRVRDGRSFSSRRVSAIQNGKTIFFCSASFHRPETGFEHQVEMPDISGPEGLDNEATLILKQRDTLPKSLYDKVKGGRPIEIRPVSNFNPYAPQKRPAIRHVWFRADGEVPDIASLHRYLLAYTTDFNLLTTSLLPHGKGFLDVDMEVASIDHSIWFHSQPNMNEWMLYSIQSPWAGEARGLSKAEIFTQDGRLIASVCQEGLIRQVKEHS